MKLDQRKNRAICNGHWGTVFHWRDGCKCRISNLELTQRDLGCTFTYDDAHVQEIVDPSSYAKYVRSYWFFVQNGSWLPVTDGSVSVFERNLEVMLANVPPASKIEAEDLQRLIAVGDPDYTPPVLSAKEQRAIKKAQYKILEKAAAEKLARDHPVLSKLSKAGPWVFVWTLIISTILIAGVFLT